MPTGELKSMLQSLGLSSRNSWLESLKTKTIHDYFGVLPDWFEDTLHVNLNIPGPSEKPPKMRVTSKLKRLVFQAFFFEYCTLRGEIAIWLS